MKFLRFISNNKISYGLLNDNIVTEIDRNFLNANYKLTKKKYNIKKIKVLAPVTPTKVIFLAYNYKDLVGYKKKYDEPLLGIKSNNSIIGSNDKIVMNQKRKTWVEVELALIIKKKCKNLNKKNALNHLFGYTIGNDVTMKNIKGRDHHLARSKSHDTFCPLGPFIETKIDTSDLNMFTYINNKLFQKGNTSNRIYKDAEAMILASKYFTLYPGDVILTGTPANAENSVINNKSNVRLSIDGLGELNNKVILDEKN